MFKSNIQLKHREWKKEKEINTAWNIGSCLTCLINVNCLARRENVSQKNIKIPNCWEFPKSGEINQTIDSINSAE